MLRELEIASNMLVLVQCNFNQTFDEVVTVSDSAVHGFAVHESVWSQDDLSKVAAFSERWRYKVLGQHGARDRAALAASLHVKQQSQLADVGGAEAMLDPVFSEVPSCVIQAKSWKLLKAHRWVGTEAIHVKEARSCLWGLRRACKSVSNHNSKRLFLLDN